MANAPVRDQLADHLITPKNSALVLIDTDLLLKNIVSTVTTAKTFGVPIVHSTVNVASGQVGPTVPELAALDALREGYEVYPVIDAIGGTGDRRDRPHRTLDQRMSTALDYANV
jgi:hypothetical protein